MKNNAPIGIFDSGLGGISVLSECKKQLPNETFLYYGDSAYSPYGEKSKQEVLSRCVEICEFLISKGVKAILIACNTATSVAAETLREMYDIPIIGMEPALKVAAGNKKNQNILVMATELTLKEQKFKTLMDTYGAHNHIMKMPCPDFVHIIEQDLSNKVDCVHEQIKRYETIFDLTSVDSIVLGCTHFVFLKDAIQSYFVNDVQLIDGNCGTIKHLRSILEETDCLGESKYHVSFYNSSKDKMYVELSKKLADGEL